MIFKRYENFTSHYPEDLKQIRNYLEQIGILNCTDKKLDNLWRYFSDDKYSASWLDPTDDSLEHFAYWLEKYEE